MHLSNLAKIRQYQVLAVSQISNIVAKILDLSNITSEKQAISSIVDFSNIEYCSNSNTVEPLCDILL